MKHILTGAAALFCTTSVAIAGGLDRSGQPIGAIFEKGGYVELAFATAQPDQKGTFTPAPGIALESGNMVDHFGRIGAAVKWDVAPNLSFAVIYDEPFGAEVDYEQGTGYPLAGTNAHIITAGITGLVRYKFDNNFSVHGGVRHVNIDSDVELWRPDPATGNQVAAYSLVGEHTDGYGYVIGAAYERPEIAMRAAITYSSAISIDQDIVIGGVLPDKLEYDLPQSVNIDLQTGIAPGTLAFAHIRWSDWTDTQINAPLYPLNPLLSYDGDVWQYEIGVARQFNEKLAGSISYSYEPEQGGLGTNLSPSDGFHMLKLGAKMSITENVALSAGVAYQWRGSVTTESFAPGYSGAEFNDNRLIGTGLKISYNF